MLTYVYVNLRLIKNARARTRAHTFTTHTRAHSQIRTRTHAHTHIRTHIFYIIVVGITLIVGGGFHGKSTLMSAMQVGVYNHIPGDGREFVVANPASVSIRAEVRA